MPVHVMLDLETFGTAPGCAIFEIAAIAFDPRDHIVSSDLKFQQSIALQSCLAAGLKIDADTMAWWFTNESIARENVAKAILQGGTLSSVLNGFRLFISTMRRLGTTTVDIRLWCHGANFDAPVLEAAYRACGLPTPWTYREVRDTRTLFELVGVTTESLSFEGTKHSAIDDAVHQAKIVQLAYRRLRGVL